MLYVIYHMLYIIIYNIICCVHICIYIYILIIVYIYIYHWILGNMGRWDYLCKRLMIRDKMSLHESGTLALIDINEMSTSIHKLCVMFLLNWSDPRWSWSIRGILGTPFSNRPTRTSKSTMKKMPRLQLAGHLDLLLPEDTLLLFRPTETLRFWRHFPLL